jgi:hypothetical protein
VTATSWRFDPGTPFTGPELVTALQAMVGEGAAFVDTLGDATFFAPQGDRWSPAEHIRHLRKGSAALAPALKLPLFVLELRFGRHRGASRTFLEMHETYKKALAAGAQAGSFAPTPEPVTPSDPVARRAKILHDWLRTNRALCDAASGWSEAKLDKAQGRHPVLGMLSVRELLEFTIFHTTHHLKLVQSRIAP